MADKLSGETKPLDNPALFDYTLREPLGVAVLITAWNSPISLLANKLAPALAAGNTVVVKPSPFTTASTLKFAEYTVEAGFPPGVFNVVVGDQEVGEYLTTDSRVDRVSFTGSVGVGKIIARQAADQLTPVTLELGGKSANIIFADADLERAIPGAVSGIFAASGQTCIAGSRLLVHRSIVDEVVAGIVKLAESIRCGDPLDPTTDMGPVAHAGQHEHILRMLAAAESSGARLATGGVEASKQLGGLFIAPTVFTDVTPDSDLAQQEVFGPALAVIPFDTDDEAVEIANSTEFGLASGIWTQNLSRAHSVAKLLRAGTVWINTYRTSAAQAPFGGVGHSGYGRERGIEALLEFTRFKNVMIDLSNDVRDPFTARF
jgi:aldehyde dehydrogenase (NAD+)